MKHQFLFVDPRDYLQIENDNQMAQSFRRIDNINSFKEFTDQLRACDLPTDGLDFERDFLLGYFEEDALVATGGLEVRGDHALLRSLSVRLGIRGKAIGSAMTERLLGEAKDRNLRAVYLLTETASEFFRRKGFQQVDRNDVPKELAVSAEFAYACPASAVVMSLDLA